MQTFRFTLEEANVAEPVHPVLAGSKFLIQSMPGNTGAIALGGPAGRLMHLDGPSEDDQDITLTTEPSADSATANGAYLEKAMDFVEVDTLVDLWVAAAVADEGVLVTRIM